MENKDSVKMFIRNDSQSHSIKYVNAVTVVPYAMRLCQFLVFIKVS
jgi:hypothetical protein